MSRGLRWERAKVKTWTLVVTKVTGNAALLDKSGIGFVIY